MRWGAVIVAAGRGTRFGRPKQLVELHGRPLLTWSVDAFASMPEVVEIVVVTEAAWLDEVAAAVEPRVSAARLQVIPGGEDRQASVRCGLEALGEDVGEVLVHDGARPLIRPADVRPAMRLVRPGIAALLAAPVVDTIKIVGPDRVVRATLDRDELWSAQTPQLATLRDLRHAHRVGDLRDAPRATDDASMLERAGIEVVVVPAPPENFKVTHPGDLARAEAVLRERGPVTDEEEVLLVETYVDPRAVDAVIAELERRGARIDGIDRELGAAVAIRAYAGAPALRGFGVRLHALAGEDALWTAHVSHTVPRSSERAR